MEIDIDKAAGFCFGVTNAIKKAETEIAQNGSVYCLGEIVHNQEESNRLQTLGMKTIKIEQFRNLRNTTVLLRAHGEPPSTYLTAEKNNVRIIDATCPIVLKLHKLIHSNSQQYPNAQTVIFGKKDHAEVVGLLGHVDGQAIVISSTNEIDQIDFSKDILLYSQTTMNSHKYNILANAIEEKLSQQKTKKIFKKYETVCKSVATREKNLGEYAANHDAIIFVAGANSSNGKYLYSTCKSANPKTYYVSSKEDITPEMTKDVKRLGITGATSTPQWLLQQIANFVTKCQY